MVPRVNTSASKLLRSSFRVVWAGVVFVAVCLAWMVLFLLFLPFLLVAEVVRLIKGEARKKENLAIPDLSTRDDETAPLIFDRRSDVSKLYGCNTRNVRYRWTLFENRLDHLQREFKTPLALDFGAGSLRDSYELATRGFNVVSFDLNDRVLRRYFDSYDWSKTHAPTSLMTGSLEDLLNQNKPGSVQLIIAFDVIEHLKDPASYVQAFNKILCAQGFLLTIVPNRRSLFERFFKHSLAQQIKRGVVPEPGVPHVQFKSPEEWDQFFEANGFRIVERDMTIGPFVNDWWNGLLSVPLRAFVFPVLEVVAYYSKRKIDTGRFERTFCPGWLMERIDLLDQLLKQPLKSRFGWNLIVAQKQV